MPPGIQQVRNRSHTAKQGRRRATAHLTSAERGDASTSARTSELYCYPRLCRRAEGIRTSLQERNRTWRSRTNGGRAPSLPHFPFFSSSRAAPASSIRASAPPNGASTRYSRPVHADGYGLLLDRLKGELGFQKQRTALLWILQQLEASPDLRGLILHLLQQGQAD